MKIQLRRKLLADGSESLYLDLYDKGKRTYEFLDIKLVKPKTTAERQNNKELLELANKIRAKREYELNNELHGFVSSAKANMDFLQYFQCYIDSYTKKDKRMFLSSLQWLQKYVKLTTKKDTISAKQLTENFLQLFRNFLEEHLNGETPHDYFSKLKRVIRRAIKDGILKYDPTSDIKNARKAAKVKDVLTFEELNILNNTPIGASEIKRAFLFSCVTGLRWCDVIILKWDSIKNDQLNIIQAKTGKAAQINLNETARKLLGKRGKLDENVFLLPSSTAANKCLQKWVERAGIEKKITWHCARHSFGTNILYYDGDILSASKLLGHSSLTYTQRYVRVVEQLKQQAVNKLPKIDAI